MRKSISLIDGDSVGDSISRVFTIPVVLPEAYRDRTAWIATYMAGVLKVSNMI